MRSNRRSKPTVDRQRGVRSKFLIATSSIEQHGYKSRRTTSDARHSRAPARAHGTTRLRGKQQIRKPFSVFKRGARTCREPAPNYIMLRGWSKGVCW